MLRHKDHKGHKDHETNSFFVIFVFFVTFVPERQAVARRSRCELRIRRRT
jgi:hypothetical protein